MNARRWLAGALAALLMGPGCAAAEDAGAQDLLGAETRLAQLGYLTGEPDGVYDDATRLAVEAFQQANGIVEVTGQLDAATLERLGSPDAVSRRDYLTRYASAYADMTPLEKGNVNNQVLVMQRRLKEIGYFSGECDGVFGDATKMAVESFQMVNGLQVTGIADGATLMCLMADAPITWPGFLAEMSAGPGDKGLKVYTLQKKLAAMGYFTGDCTANYGDLTWQAVSRFQSENGLEPTGNADAATWAAIYSGAAVAPRREDVMQFGDFGERVQEMQQRLKLLGYYEYGVTGEYDYATETGVRLFQMANDMASTGEADKATIERMLDENAWTLGHEVVQQRFFSLLQAADDNTQGAIAEIANRMLGTAFGSSEDELYPGFAFVQYVCVTAGLPVTQPEELVRLADVQVSDPAAVEPGDVVAFQRADSDSVTIQLAIGAGDGKVIHATPEGGWVVLGYIDQMDSTTVFRWDAKAGAAQ